MSVCLYSNFLNHFKYYPPVGGTVIAGGNCDIVIQADKTADYKAYNEIRLLPGFHAERGSNFRAHIIPCPLCPDNKKSLMTTAQSELTLEKNIFNPRSQKKDTTNISNFSTEWSFDAYPNPFNQILYFHCTFKQETNFSVNLYTIEGDKVEQLVHGFQPSGKYAFEYNTNNLTPGMYICVFKSRHFNKTVKLIKH